MKFGYSEDGRVFMFEKTPSVLKLSGIHLEKISKVRRFVRKVDKSFLDTLFC